MEESLARLKSHPSPLRSVGLSDSGNPQYRGLGVVFGGRDLYGDTFARPRDFLVGDDPDLKLGTEYFLSELADEVDRETGEIRGALWEPVHWDHGLGNLGGKRLGKAKPVKITEEGIEYLIEVEKQRAQEYQQMIDELQNEGWLGLSSQTLPSFASFDWSTWEIKSWYIGEMTLTTTPAEHRTRESVEKVRSLFKKYGVKIMEEDQNTLEQPETISDELDELFEELSGEIAEEEEAVVTNEALAYVIRSFDALNASIKALNERLDTVDEAMAQAATAEEITLLRTQMVDGFKTMTRGLSETLIQATRSKAAQLVQNSSDMELDILRTGQTPAPAATPARTRSGYRILPHAPGQN